MRTVYILIIISVFLLNSCKQKAKIPPNVPSEKTMFFDFLFFQQNTNGGDIYTFASEKVLKWKALLDDSLLLYHNILENSNTNEFNFQKDNAWLNNFSFNLLGTDYDVNLFAIFDDDSIKYKTYLTTDSILDLVFLNGNLHNEKKQGSWEYYTPIYVDTLYKSTLFLSSDWDFTSKNKISFTNYNSGINNLNKITFLDSIDAGYNKYIEIFNKNTGKLSIIQWNNLTKEGRLKDSVQYGNLNWHKWNSNLENEN